MSSLPTIDDVHAAAARIAGHAVLTPLLSSALIDEIAGARVLIKAENLQRTGTFKFRGAYNAVAAMTAEQRAGGIVAVSSGNHAQGVAEAARLFGAASTVVMPADAPSIKRARTERSGGRIVTYDRATQDRDAVVADYIALHGGTLVHPYNDFHVIAGQGTIGLEAAEQCAALGIVPAQVLVPCGGGGLSSGVGLAMRRAYPDIAVTLVEPDGFDDYRRSLAAGMPVTNAKTSGSVCDALLAPSPGAIGFALNQAHHAAAVSVSDGEALATVAFAFRELKLVVEPGGAAALAALLAGKVVAQGEPVVVVLSGGNIDPPVLARALAEFPWRN
ncbi:MAG TPA: threonine/serine dehydratase [Bauldia sp.]|nr:threonine/serine dehydratase [Bauldia sp.]